MVTAWAEDVAGNKSATSAPLNVTVDSVAPAVTAAEFVDQPGGQGVRFTFSENVAGTLDATDLIVRHLPNGPDLAIASVSYDDVANAATFYFAEPVSDGDYSATLLAGSSDMPAVSDAAGNPLAGGGRGVITSTNSPACPACPPRRAACTRSPARRTTSSCPCQPEPSR